MSDSPESYSPQPPVPQFKSRHTALLVFGIFEILLGAVCCLFVLLMGFNAVQMARMGGSMSSLIPSILMYVLAAAMFFTLGIGSIRCRRWARSLWLALSSSWFLGGIVGVAMALYWLPRVLRGLPQGPQGGPPPEVMMGIMIGVMIFMALIMLLLPLVLFLFYRSPHVKATCESEQTEASWTDPLPFPVLAAALWTAMMCVTMLGMAFTYKGAHPFFGTYILGPAGVALWVGGSLLYLASAVGLLKGRQWGWLLGLAWIVVSTVSSTITFLKTDARFLFEAMGMPDMQLQIVEKMGMMSPEYMISISVAFMLPVAFMLAWAGMVMPRTPEAAAR